MSPFFVRDVEVPRCLSSITCSLERLRAKDRPSTILTNKCAVRSSSFAFNPQHYVFHFLQQLSEFSLLFKVLLLLHHIMNFFEEQITCERHIRKRISLSVAVYRERFQLLFYIVLFFLKAL